MYVYITIELTLLVFHRKGTYQEHFTKYNQPCKPISNQLSRAYRSTIIGTFLHGVGVDNLQWNATNALGVHYGSTVVLGPGCKTEAITKWLPIASFDVSSSAVLSKVDTSLDWNNAMATEREFRH